MSRHKFLCRDRGWSRPRDLMLQQSFLELCHDKVFLCCDRLHTVVKKKKKRPSGFGALQHGISA